MNGITKLALAAACGLALSACGGGGGDDTVNSPLGATPGSGGGNSGATPGGSGSGGQTAYTVTPSVSGSGGSISPATPVSVSSGATTSFTLKPNAGYSAVVTGTCGGTLSGTAYTTHAITANCTVVATFSISSGSNSGTPSGGGSTQSGSGASGYVVTTVAGLPNAAAGSTDGSPAQATFNLPTGVAVAPDGSLYVADNNNFKIRKIAVNGTVSTVAGIGSYNYADGPCASAAFRGPTALVVDAAGTIYVADSSTSGSTVRRITNPGTSACQVSTLAGADQRGGYADGVGTSALFGGVLGGIALDASGNNLYVTEEANNCIRKVTSAGVVTTLAGTCSPSSFGYADGTGLSAKFTEPAGIAVDQEGNVYVGDYGDNHIRKITPSGTVSTLASSTAGQPGYFSGEGSPNYIGGPGATFEGLKGLAIDADGTLYAADATNLAIYQITPSGQVTTLAGGTCFTSKDCPAAQACFQTPYDVAIDASGAIYTADRDSSTIRKIALAQ